VMITKAAEKAGLCEIGTADRIIGLLEKYGMPTETMHNEKDIVAVAMSDKKRRSNTINTVLLKKIGDSFIYPIECEKFEDFLKRS
ncbi:MAG: 3-dehydroquinate synthase, partial [Acutalibacteraceae bacterium]|nr:3-dehydroquinate synthase [Acutalibacteraceae bacterium]